jgi:hypothetical protein
MAGSSVAGRDAVGRVAHFLNAARASDTDVDLAAALV